MDWQILINVGASVLLALVGGFVANVRREAREMQQAFNDFRVQVAENYVTTHDLVEIKNALIRIEARLDSKVNR